MKFFRKIKKILLTLFCFPLLLSSTCEDDDKTIYCTEEIVSGLVVKIALQGESSTTADGITVIAKDENYTEELTAYDPNIAEFKGAQERKGNYTIAVSKNGYKTFISNAIQVKENECHVITETVNVILEKQ